MNAIVISIDPVIFRLGSFEIRWYVVAIISAIVVALSGVLRRKALHILLIKLLLPLVLWWCQWPLYAIL